MMDDLLAYRIPWFPDISRASYVAKYRGQAHRVASERLFDVLMQMATFPTAVDNLTFCLRYLVDPSRSSQDRLSVFLLLSAEQNDRLPLASLSSNLEMLRPFFPVQPLADEELVELGEQAIGLRPTVLAIVKKEELLREGLTQGVYYAPKPFCGRNRTEVDALFWDELFDTIGGTAPCMVDIVLRPTTLSKLEQAALMWLMGEPDKSSILGFDRVNIGAREELVSRDPLAERHGRIYRDYVERMFSDLIFEYQIRVASADRGGANRVAHTVGVELTGNGEFEVVAAGQQELADWPEAIRTGRLTQQRFDCQGLGPSCSSALALSLKDLPLEHMERASRFVQLSRLRLLVDKPTVREFLRLPIPRSGYLKTFRLETELGTPRSCHISGDSSMIGTGEIWIGTDLERSRPAVSRVDQLNKHAFFSGVTGSGKTTSVLNLLKQLWETFGIPFLVLEPVKTEYRTLKLLGGRTAADLEIYTLGVDHISPFRFNPFCFGSRTSLSEHVSNLDLCFKGALPLVNPMPALIAEAIDRLYEDLGWQEDELGGQGKLYPSMLDLPVAVRRVMRERNYTGEVRRNIETAIDVRLGLLCRRNVGRIFSTSVSVPSMEELLSRPVILEMDSLTQEQVNLMCLFVLMALRELLKVRGPVSELRHVLVLEEAHNLVGTSNREVLLENIADPKGEATRFIVRMLAEVRALGEGMIIVDQTPAAVAPEVIKSTNVKVVHRTVAGDDRDVLSQAMLLNEVQEQELARLQPGEAFLYHEKTYRPIKILSRNVRSEHTLALANAELRERIVAEPWYIARASARAESVAGFVAYWLKRIESYIPHWQERTAELLSEAGAADAPEKRTECRRIAIECLRILNRSLARIRALRSALSKDGAQLLVCTEAASGEEKEELAKLLSREDLLERELSKVKGELDNLCTQLESVDTTR